MYSFLNSDYLPADTAALRVPDLSIQRGYGLFDFFKTINHKPVFCDDHLNRFFRSAERLRLHVGKTREELKAIVAGLQQRNDLADSGIRLTLTGGYSSDGYSLATPNLIITQQPLMIDLKAECPPPIRIITYAHQRQLPDIKTIDYLMAIWLQPCCWSATQTTFFITMTGSSPSAPEVTSLWSLRKTRLSRRTAIC
jgi:branched-chain amino acid aminotransferase